MSIHTGLNVEPEDDAAPEHATVEQLRQAVAARVRSSTTVPTAELRPLVEDEIAAWVRQRAQAGLPPPSTVEERQLAHHVLAALSGLGGLAPLLQREDVENIHIHGCDRVFLELADGTLQRWPRPVASSDQELLDLLSGIFARRGRTSREFSPAAPIGNLRLPDGGPLGARLSALREVTDRPRVAIRRHRHSHASLDTLTELGTLTPTVREFLSTAVAAGLNLLVTGGPAAGKTTLLRALAHQIPACEHVVTVEDDSELGLHLDEDRLVTAAEAREANGEGHGQITLDDLLTQALRHSPSRVLVGEVRGGEITSLLRALGNGAAGGMGTLHAAAATSVPQRISALAQLAQPPLPTEAAHQWTATALDLIVHITRDDRDTPRKRRVSQVVEVGPVGDAHTPDLTSLFRPDPSSGQAQLLHPPSPTLRARLEHAGLDPHLLHPEPEGNAPTGGAW